MIRTAPLPAVERARRAESARKAYFLKLALRSAQVRRRKARGAAATTESDQIAA